MLRGTNDIASVFLTKIYNLSKGDLIFPETLRNGDVVPIHKKEEKQKRKLLA